MNLLFAMIQITLCVGIILFEYKKKSIGVFFWAILLVIFAVPHFIGAITGVNEYSEKVIIKASIFVILFELIYILTRKIITNKTTKFALKNEGKDDIDLKEEVNQINFKRYFKINLLVIIIFIIYFLISFKKIIGISWGEMYLASINNGSMWKKIIELIKDFNVLIYFSVTGLLFTSFMAKKRTYTIIIALIIIYYSFVTKNRIGILPLIVSIIAIFIYTHNKISIKQIIILATIGILTLYTVYALLIYRHSGSMDNFVAQYHNFSDFNKEVANYIVNGEGELGLRNIFYYFISIDNNFPGLGEGATYWRIALMFIPTKLSFGLKPPDFAITMSSAYTGDMNNVNYSVHPTFFGDAYANYSWIGIFLGVLWAFIIYVIDKHIYIKDYITRTLLIVIWGTALIIVGRGSVYNGMYIGIISTIIVNILAIFRKKKIVFNK